MPARSAGIGKTALKRRRAKVCLQLEISVFDELRAIQREFGYLPVEQLHLMSRRLNIPVSQIHAVVSFYPHFRLTAPPKLDVRVCSDMTCHLRGAELLESAIRTAFRHKSSD